MIAAMLLAWFKLLALYGDLAKGRVQDASLPGAACRPAGPRRPPPVPQNPRQMPWADAIIAAWQRITALPQAP
jgi:hypothetical protein